MLETVTDDLGQARQIFGESRVHQLVKAALQQIVKGCPLEREGFVVGHKLGRLAAGRERRVASVTVIAYDAADHIEAAGADRRLLLEFAQRALQRRLRLANRPA